MASGANANANPNKVKNFPLVPFLAGLGIVSSILFYQYQRYGMSLFVDRSSFDSSYSASEWHGILSNKTLLLIGGPHRGGTTVLWKALDAHPDISGLGTEPPAEDGSDDAVQKRKCGEGILIQDVYSRRGIGMEHMMKSNLAFQKRMMGLGKYALGKEDQVHLNESEARVTPQNMAKLLNRYNHYWNTSKSVLVEKSPPNAVMSRFLQAIYNEGRTAEDGLQIRFLFMTRHPIANALAHQSILRDTYDVPFSTLMNNYVQVHRYLREDMPHLRNDPMLIKLEEFASNPKAQLEKIYRWLGVDGSSEIVKDVLEHRMQESIRDDPNSKYKEKWCRAADSNDRSWHAAIASKYQPLIDDLQLGYDITDGWCK